MSFNSWTTLTLLMKYDMDLRASTATSYNRCYSITDYLPVQSDLFSSPKCVNMTHGNQGSQTRHRNSFWGWRDLCWTQFCDVTWRWWWWWWWWWWCWYWSELGGERKRRGAARLFVVYKMSGAVSGRCVAVHHCDMPRRQTGRRIVARVTTGITVCRRHDVRLLLRRRLGATLSADVKIRRGILKHRLLHVHTHTV